MNYFVKIDGFKTKHQAEEFIHWYEGGGEQAFDDHLTDNGMNPNDGCYIDNKAPNKSGLSNEIYAKVITK